jgi:hypothetical protein
MNERIIELGKDVKKGTKTWEEVSNIINQEFGTNLSNEAVRKRFERNCENKDINGLEYTTEYGNGVIEAQKIVEYNKEIFGDRSKLLAYLGYNPNEWEFVYVTTSTWNQHTKEQTTKQLYAVKFKVKPIVNEANIEDAIECAKKLFTSQIEPLKLKIYPKDNTLNKNKLLEIPAIELHLGKMAWGGDTGQDYDKDIATNRFYYILEQIINIQEQEQ